MNEGFDANNFIIDDRAGSATSTNGPRVVAYETLWYSSELLSGYGFPFWLEHALSAPLLTQAVLYHQRGVVTPLRGHPHSSAGPRAPYAPGAVPYGAGSFVGSVNGPNFYAAESPLLGTLLADAFPASLPASRSSVHIPTYYDNGSSISVTPYWTFG